MESIIISLILFILSLLCLYFSLRKDKKVSELRQEAQDTLKQAEKIKYEKDNEQEQYLFNLLNQISISKDELSEIKTKIAEENDKYILEKDKINELIKANEKNLSYAGEQYIYALEQSYSKLEKDFDLKVSKYNKQEEQLNTQIKKLEQEISNMRESLAANTKAALREQEKKNKLDFYKLTLTPFELEDIIKLNTIKTVLHQPVVLSKLIWSTYFQKQTTEMCNRILGTSKICGIYKITYLETEQSYIGQSVNIGA